MSLSIHTSIDRSHVVLIDCLPIVERSIRLADDIQDIVNASPCRKTTQYIGKFANGRSELFDCLENVCTGFEACSTPEGLILQLEGHGADFPSNINEVGIAVGDRKESVTWGELNSYLCRLYRASAGKITLNVSACWGYTALTTAAHTFADDCAPFRNLVSPSDKRTTHQLNLFWHDFYSTIFNDLNLSECLRRHPSFNLLTIERFLADFALNTGQQLTDEEFQRKLHKEGLGFHELDEIREKRRDSQIEHVKNYLLLNCFPDLADSIDTEIIGLEHAEIDVSRHN